MIKINLLPIRDLVRRKKSRDQIIAAIVTLGVFICALLAIAGYQSSSISGLKEELAHIEAEKGKYSKILADIKKIEDEKKLLATRTEVINQLKQSSSLTVHVLDEIANLTPPSRMWLKTLSQAGNQLALTGMALDDQTIARYMDELEASDFIQGVRLASSSLEKVAERSLKAFSITASVGVSKQADTPNM
jgi:type IV pilus assembly protein PilN